MGFKHFPLLVALLFTFPAIATQANNLEPLSFSQLRDRCVNSVNSEEEAKCFEAYALKAYPNLATRAKHTLRVKIGTHWKDFTDLEKNDDLEISYSFLGYDPRLESYLIHEQYYEGSSTLLIQRHTGKAIELLGSPLWNTTLLFSPNELLMLDYNYDLSAYTESGLRIYQLDKTQGLRLLPNKIESCFNVEKQSEESVMEEINAAWLNDAHIKLTMREFDKSWNVDVVCPVTTY